MIHHGARPTTPDHRDYDFHPSFGSIAPDRFPDEYLTDANLTMPDQNAEGEPYGCTNFSQADISTDETLILKSPFDLEAVTHANARGGYDIRKSLDAATKLGWFSAYFTVNPYGLDFFDSVRLAMYSGFPEKRSVSVGTPWYPEFESKLQADGIMPEPANYSADGMPWHNWAVKGWTTKNGQPYLICKSWQGKGYGNNGYAYIPRTLFNQMMRIRGTCAFTATNITPDTIIKIDLPAWQVVWSYLRNLLSFSY